MISKRHPSHYHCFIMFIPRDTPSKKNIIFNEDKTRISFQENSSIEFLYKESNGTLDDLIVVPNIPLLVSGKLNQLNPGF